jgi:hypothetical protein
MKRQLLFLRILSLIAAIGISLSASALRLSGAYTINPALPASATNFQNFASAVTYLNSSGVRADGGVSNSAPFGVSGPVTFNVAAGTYPFTTALIIDTVSGASAVNTITFTGGTGNASTRIITGSIGNSALVVMNGAMYVSFQNLTINNLFSGNCTGIAVVGTNTSNLGTGSSVKNCIVNLPNTGSATSYGINVTTSALGYGFSATRVDSVSIENNIVTGGYYGIGFYGASNSSYNRNNSITGNTVNNAYYYGIYMAYNYNPVVVSYNTVSMFPSTSTNYGLYVYYNQNSNTTVSTEVSYNKVNAGVYGAYVYYNSIAPTSAPLKVYNNSIFTSSGSTTAGLYVYNSTTSGPVECIHNTIVSAGSGSTTSAAFYYYGATLSTSIIKNNIFIARGVAYPAYFSSNPGNVVNYNVYYNSAGANLLYRTSAHTVTTYRAVAAGGDSSFNTNISFAGSNDPHLGLFCSPRGVDLNAKTPLDLDGQARTSTPFVGSDEMPSITNDLSARAVTNLSYPVTPGMQDIVVRVRNTGSNSISAFSASYTLNGAAPVTQTYTGPALASCDTVSITFSGANQANILTTNDLKVYTSSPNGVADNNHLNDTISVTPHAPLSGSYTIGGATPDFAGFAQALSALKYGVSGPVVFNVAPGIYTGQIFVTDTIPGASAINNIVFDGGSGSAATITANAPGAAVLIFNECKYVTFTHFTINNTSTSASAGVAFVGNMVNDKGSSNALKHSVINLSAPDGSMGYGILATGIGSGLGLSDNKLDSIVIDSNTINGGNSHGISIWGKYNSASAGSNRGHRIAGNVINNSYLFGIYAYYNYSAMTVSGNTINMSTTTPGSTNSYGIYFYYNQNASGSVSTVISNNKVKDATNYGIYAYYTNSTVSNPTKVYNNMIAGGFRSATNAHYGLYVYGSSAVAEVYNNSINMDFPTSSTIYGFYYYGATSGSFFKNNIFAVTAVGAGTAYPAYFSTNPTGNVVNYNQYFNASSANAVYRGSNYTNTTYLSAVAGGDSSYFMRPNWIADKDLSLADGCGLTGVNLSAFNPMDIKGRVRSTSTPKVGVDEYWGHSNDLKIDALITPVAPITTGTQDLVVRVKNVGNTTVSNFNVSYKLNTAAPVTLTHSTPLAPCDTVSIVFTGSDQITLGAVNDLHVYTEDPNSMADSDPANDSVAVLYIAPLNGTYTIGGPTADFPTFAEAADLLHIAGVSGPVTFTVNPGTYTDPVTFYGPVAGMSDINTVTVDGVDTATRQLTVTAPGTAAFIINGISYFTVKNLSVTNLATTVCSGIANVGNALGNEGTGVIIRKCAVKLPNTGTSTSYGIILTGIPTGAAESNQLTDSMTIDSNVITGGYYGIVVSTGSNGNVNYNRHHRIIANHINNAYYYGIRVNYIFNPISIRSNVINMNTVNNSSYGIYINYNQTTTSTPGRSTVIAGNTISAGYSGLYSNYHTSTTADPHRIHNNFITAYSPTAYCGLYIYTYATGGGVVNIHHNTVRMKGASASNGVYYYDYYGSTTASSMKNNIFYAEGATTYPAYIGTGMAVGAVNHNLYYNALSGPLVYRNGTVYGAATYKTAANGGDSSYNFNPLGDWVSADDMHLTSGCGYSGTDLSAQIATDIDGDVRPTIPSIGADEPLGSPDDMAIDALISPSSPAMPGLQDLEVRIKNKGNNIVSTVDVYYSVNGGAPKLMPVATPLNPCDTLRVLFTGAEQINMGAINDIRVYVSNPNSTTDGNPKNDTLRILINTPLSGTYTIGGPTADYPTFADAAAALKAGGVSAPVTFTVNPGTYNEQVEISGPVYGLSQDHPVVFDGVDASTRIVTSNVSNGATFKVNQVSYVTVKNLTITNLGTTNSAGIALIGNTTDNSGTGFRLKHSVINLPNTGTNTSWGVLVTGNPGASSELNQFTDSVRIDSNIVNGGYYGITVSAGTSGTGVTTTSNRGHRISGNTLNNTYYMGIRVGYIFNPILVNYNTINMSTVPSTNYGIYSYYNQYGTGVDTSSTIIANKISATYYGIYLYYQLSTNARPVKLYNNMVVVPGSGYGIYMYGYSSTASAYVAECHHNSVNMTYNGSNTGYAMYYYNSTTGAAPASTFKNNIFATAGTNMYPAYFSTNPPGNAANYNVYYNSASGALVYRGSALNASNYRTATGGGDSSFNLKPLFVSATDLHTSNACLRGTDLSSLVALDMDGNTRSTAPVIGAHEAAGLANDISVEAVTYTAPVVAGLQDLAVRIKNNSVATVSSFDVTYVLNGGTPVTFSWTGTLNGCDTVTHIFTSSDQMDLPAGLNTLKAYVSSPNGLSDDNRLNDTITSPLSTITIIPGSAYNGNGAGGAATGTYVRVADKPSIIGAGTTGFTVEAWVRLPDVTSNQKIVAKSSTTNGFVLGVQNGGIYPEIWTVANGTGSINFTAGTIPVNTWTHLAVTWESGVGVKAYINGMQVGQALSGTTTTITQSTNDMVIGASSWDIGFPVTGMVDEVRTWTVALDSTFIRRNMHRTVPAAESFGLTSYLQFNEGPSATTVVDPVSGATATIAGSPLATSTAPVGGDSSMTFIATSGVFAVNGDLTINFNDGFDNICDLTLTEIPFAPNALPSATHTFGDKYWIIRPFGDPGVFSSDLTFEMPAGYLNLSDANLGLYRRGYNGQGSWVLARTSASITPTSVNFSAIDTFGQFTIASNGTSPLPVSLLSFGGKRAGETVVGLNWTTAQEINSRGFEVERSYTGENFEAIGFVKSTGSNKATKNAYAYTDKTVNAGKAVYYRLKQLDMDGKYAYSPVVFIEATGTKASNSITAYPNPFSDNLNVELSASAAGAATLRIVDIAGKVLYSANHHMAAGSNTLNIDADSLQSGVYFLSVEMNNTRQTIKVTK